MQDIREVVETAIAGNSVLDLDIASKSYIRCFDPRWDDLLPLLKGRGWTSSGRMLLLEFQNQPESLSISLVLGPGPERTRKQIFDRAVEVPRVFKPARKTMPSTFASLYRRSVLRKQDYENVDLDAIRNKVEKAIDDLITNDLDDIFREVKQAISAG